MGAMSHVKITYQNENSDILNRQVTLVLPNSVYEIKTKCSVELRKSGCIILPLPITDSGYDDQATWRKIGEDSWINSNKLGHPSQGYSDPS